MGILGWIVVGLIAGWLAKLVVPGREPGGFLATTAIGIVGALIGGFIWSAMGRTGVTGFDIGSIFVAFIGAVILLILYHAVTGRSRV
jgi:uncharacterized membrane protein YeaQ/YmgE (transglycosylase-associated protein family)